MAYTVRNFKTKKAFKEAFLRGERLEVYRPGIGEKQYDPSRTSRICIEGPHYPEPHTWYANVEIRGGFITRILGKVSRDL